MSLADYPLPLYDGDLEAIRAARQRVNLKRMISAHPGHLSSTPEYNSSVTPLLKNAIDWVRGCGIRTRPSARRFASGRSRSARRPEAGSAARAS